MKGFDFDKFRKDFKEAMSSLEESHKVSIKLGKMRYSDTHFDATLNVALKEINGKSAEQILFERQCSLFDMKPEHYNKTIVHGGNKLTLKGFNLRSPKYSVKIEQNGTSYKFTESILRHFRTTQDVLDLAKKK